MILILQRLGSIKIYVSLQMIPYNFVQFSNLQEILAGWLELDVGSYNHYNDSLYLYNRDISKIGIGWRLR